MIRKTKLLLTVRADIRRQAGYSYSYSARRISRVDYEEMRAEVEELEFLEYISGP